MYASIRQGKAKPGMAEELTRRIKEGAIPIISDVTRERRSQTGERWRGSSKILRRFSLGQLQRLLDR